ncbi:MAG TPA: OsmC family protein [Anaerolineae bacterium]|nr:OsmC family protein [Anaerolineae bacterium]
MSGLDYHVSIVRLDDARAIARTREHTLTLNVKKGDGKVGFNAAETLMAAFGTCIMTNVNAISQKMHLKIDDAEIDIHATRQDEPPVIIDMSYELIITSTEPREKIEELHELCIKWGTVTNTLLNGINPEGKLVVRSLE